MTLHPTPFQPLQLEDLAVGPWLGRLYDLGFDTVYCHEAGPLRRFLRALAKPRALSQVAKCDLSNLVKLPLTPVGGGTSFYVQAVASGWQWWAVLTLRIWLVFQKQNINFA